MGCILTNILVIHIAEGKIWWSYTKIKLFAIQISFYFFFFLKKKESKYFLKSEWFKYISLCIFYTCENLTIYGNLEFLDWGLISSLFCNFISFHYKTLNSFLFLYLLFCMSSFSLFISYFLLFWKIYIKINEQTLLYSNSVRN